MRETEKDKRGIFIEIKPNLIGMAEYKEGLQYGQKVDVYVKKIVKETYEEKAENIINQSADADWQYFTNFLRARFPGDSITVKAD